MRIISGHQPVYLPWLGLFHKITLCDVFVFMDDVQYLKQDWNNRNKIKGAQGPFFLTVPVSLKKSASMLLKDIVIVEESWDSKNHWQKAHWKSLKSCYGRAPFWDKYAEELEKIYLDKPWSLLSELNFVMLDFFIKCLGIDVEIVKASEIGFEGKKSDLIIDHCKKLDGDYCVLGTHGKNYLCEEEFKKNNIGFYYQNYNHPIYPQMFSEFTSHMSIVDLLFNCGPDSLNILQSENIKKSDLVI